MQLIDIPPRYLALAAGQTERTLCRVISQEKGCYRVADAKGEQIARVSGRFMNEATCGADYPAVGDYCLAKECEGQPAIIQTVSPRTSAVERKAAGHGLTGQIVAANIDTLFLCMSLNRDYNLRRLERYLTVAFDSGATPVVLLTKADLCDCLPEKIRAVSESAVGVPILTVTHESQDGYEAVKRYLKKGETVALIGSSGVGKSTLINCLIGEDRLATDGLRRDDRGHHTTTRRQLFCLSGGAMILDTPGMREMGLPEGTDGIHTAFAEIEALAAQCRFSDCTHTTEPGCAVCRALADGTLSGARWQAYCKLRKEAAFSTDTESYLREKKEKFKQIGRLNHKNRSDRKDI